MPDHYLLELLQGFLAVLVPFERAFEHPGCKLQERGELLEGVGLALRELNVDGVEVQQQLFEGRVYRCVPREHPAEGVFENGRL